MRKFGVLIGLTAVIQIGIASPLLAKHKKLTYEQAWAHCKALLDKEKTPGTTTMANDRMVRGGACMHHYGYRL